MPFCVHIPHLPKVSILNTYDLTKPIRHSSLSLQSLLILFICDPMALFRSDDDGRRSSPLLQCTVQVGSTSLRNAATDLDFKCLSVSLFHVKR